MDSKNKVSNVRKTFTRCGAVLGTLVTIGATAVPIVTPLIANADDITTSGAGTTTQQPNIIAHDGSATANTSPATQNNANGHMGDQDADKFPDKVVFHEKGGFLYFWANSPDNSHRALGNIFRTDEIYTDSLGHGQTPAYCIAPWNSSPNGSTGSQKQLLNEKQSAQVLQAIYYGYNTPNKVDQFGGGVTPSEAYIATQCAIWTSLGGEGTGNGNGVYQPRANATGAQDPGAMKAYNYIMGKINHNLTVEQFEAAINKSGQASQQKLDQVKAQLTKQAQQAVQQAIAQKKATLQKSVSFAVEGLDNSNGNAANGSSADNNSSSSSNSSSDATSNSSSNASSTTKSLGTSAANSSSATTNSDNKTDNSSSSKKYNSNDDDVNNPDKSFIIHTSADKTMQQDGQTTIVLKNKLPNGTKVVQDGKEITISDGNTAKPTPATNESSNASSASNGSSAASASSNSVSANSVSAAKNAVSAVTSSASSVTGVGNNTANGSSANSSANTNDTVKMPDGQSSFVVKNNDKFTIELPKDQSYQTTGTAITSDAYHANFTVAPHGGIYKDSVPGTPVQQFETQTYDLSAAPHRTDFQGGPLVPEQNMITSYGSVKPAKTLPVQASAVGKGDASAQPSGDLEMQYKHANNTTTTTGGNTSGGCTSQGGCGTTQGGTGSQGGKTLADTAAGLPGVVMATIASAVASLGAAVALMKKHLFGTSKK